MVTLLDEPETAGCTAALVRNEQIAISAATVAEALIETLRL